MAMSKPTTRSRTVLEARSCLEPAGAITRPVGLMPGGDDQAQTFGVGPAEPGQPGRVH
jgi:hypothetical protein